ncbi:hypothetical protein AMJ86_07035, partial [bacterium SM23_57]
MLKNYLKITFRNILRQKGYSFINIAGLAVGIAVCILFILWIQDELSYDKFHQLADRIHLVAVSNQLETGQQTIPTQVSTVGPLLKDNIPEVEDVVRLYQSTMATLKYSNNTFQEQVNFADPTILTMFTFPVIYGDPATPMNDPHSIVLTESMAKKYFGDENPIGKIMTAEDAIDLTVTAVIEDLPHNSTFDFESLIPILIMNEIGYNLDEPAGADYFTFLLLQENVTRVGVTAKIQNYLSEYFMQLRGSKEFTSTFLLHPFTKLHLHAVTGTGGQIQYVYIFSLVALSILIIACMNFINITTAQSVNRAKEICLRKVIGANRLQLVRQLLGESIILSIIAAILAVGIVELLLPLFNHYTGKELTIGYDNHTLMLGLLAIIIATSALSGIVPAIYLSAFQPVKVMKAYLKSGKSAMVFRRILVVTQFALSLILIMGTIVISAQVNYLRHKDLGFNKDNVIFMIPSSGISDHYQSFKQELLKNSNITNVTASAQGIAHINSTIGNNWDVDGRDPNQKLELHFDWVSLDYAETFGIAMADGRFYSKEYPTDLSEGIILNESAVKLMGIKDPIGKRFNYWGN